MSVKGENEDLTTQSNVNPMREVEEGEEDEEMGDPTGGLSDDSSEEQEEDEEEARRIREGFIVDEDEDEDDEGEGDVEDGIRKKRKRRRKNRDVEDVLEDDDLELLEENTGRRVDRQRLTRIRRVRDSESPVEPTTFKPQPQANRRQSTESLDGGGGIEGIWEDDDRAVREVLDDEDLDMDDFIDDDDQDEGMAEEEREERRRERKRLEKERTRALGSRPELTGIDAVAWDEIYEVFGDGTDYDWALEGEQAAPEDERASRASLKFTDVFEPSEIKARMLTDEDDIIRLQDQPERMQLANSTLSSSTTPIIETSFSREDLDDAAHWVTLRLSERHERDYFRPDGRYRVYLTELISAVRRTLEFLFLNDYEAPFIYTHKRDYLSHFDPEQPSTDVEFLRRDDVWKVYSLGRKYQAFLERRKSLEASYRRLEIRDDYFENRVRDDLDSVEAVVDATDWLSLKHRTRKRDEDHLRFHDDDEAEFKKKKLPNRISSYDIVKNSVLSKLADDFGMKSFEVVLNYRATDSATKEFFVEDQDFPPLVHAEAFGNPNGDHQASPEHLLQQARMLIATELGKDPLLRKDVRELFKREALVSVTPTERGITKIDEHHPFNHFKYLRNKPVRLLTDSPQFLHMLAAESEHLVTISIELGVGCLHDFETSLSVAFSSDSFSDTAKAWNEQRGLIVREALESHLLPMAVRYTREWIRDEAQNSLAKRCAEMLRERIHTKGFQSLPGELYPRVLAVSWGKGDPQKDAITVVFLDENGTLRDNIKLDNLVDDVNKDSFTDLIERREPVVVVVGGFSIQTTNLVAQIKEVLKTMPSYAKPIHMDTFNQRDVTTSNPMQIVYATDEVARMYQNSRRAAEEFSALSLNAKYCVGIARYAQNPLNEFAALGEDLGALTLDEEIQNLIPKEKLLQALERTLVDEVNDAGVDINRAVTDPYYKHLLPFVSGLGPRKAQAAIKKIASLGGNLVNRQHLIRADILTTTVFINAAGFLRIVQSPESRIDRSRVHDDSELPDPLDDTRVHPEDYELARKMAADALDLDEEDIQDEHASHVVSQIMQAKDGARRLDELNLDDFAVNMYNNNNEDLKRHTLNAIRAELLQPFADHRKPFVYPTDWQVLTMLTSETRRTLRVGLIVSVMITRIKSNYVVVRLDSGLEGVINTQYLADNAPSEASKLVKKGQTILGVIIDIKMDLPADSFGLELSSRQSDTSVGDTNFRRVAIDEEFYDMNQAQRDHDILQRKKRSESNQARRVIKHPNFHNFNSAQAEAFLAKQQRGDAIVRPSSKGQDHLAVTWKVDEGLFQHIDVLEPNADVTQQTVGKQLIIESINPEIPEQNQRHEFADIDELIVNHVQALARRVEELMAHEKYKRGTDEAVRKELDDFVKANPAKSIYCFTLNRKKPGHFNLVFKASLTSPIQTWPVRVTPTTYHLFEAVVPSVPELCDAFKYRHLYQSNLPGGSGKTPYGGRTPGRLTTPGHRTPGRMSVRQPPTRTPNPYSGSTAPPSAPPGMNPQRQAMIQSTGGWGA